ncbi:MAG: prolyl oligopeptidase family serine peptidase [Gemmataceae bacterium]
MITLPLIALALAAAPEPTKHEFTVGDEKRETLIYVPAKSDKPMPVVFAFHGHGGTAHHAARTFAYHTHWPEAVCVYMQGLPTPGQLTDPDGKKAGWQAKAGDQGDRDLKFFDEVLKTLKKDHAIDDNRIYCTGHSNGGGFTYLLWAQRGDVFAAVAPSAAVARYAKDLKPKPCLHVMGEKDSLVKPEWQKTMTETVRKVNGCDAAGKEWAKAGKLVGTVYESKGGTPFVALVGPGGHEFPPEAPKLIVQFFQQHAKK